MTNITDKDGLEFNPEIHQVNEDGTPSLTKDGENVKRKAGLSLEKAQEKLGIEVAETLAEVDPLDEVITYTYRDKEGSYTLGELKNIVSTVLTPHGVVGIPDVKSDVKTITIRGGSRIQECFNIQQPLNTIRSHLLAYVSVGVGKDGQETAI